MTQLQTSSSDVGRYGRLGKTEPRLYTPPLRELTPDTSLGFEVIDLIENGLGEQLLPWQKWFYIHSLELAPGSTTEDEYPQLRFDQITLLVARQNGKSYTMSRRGLWRMLLWEGPEAEGTLILGAAHKLPTALEIMELTAKAMLRSKLRSHLVAWNKGAGQQLLESKNGARYKIEAANDDGGRGLSVTDLLFDELRQQEDWKAWSALANTTTARFSSQVMAVSNAGTAKSSVLRALRKANLKLIAKFEQAIADGVDPLEYALTNDVSSGHFEWSAQDDCDIMDVDGWAAANPSMGWPTASGLPLLTEKSMRAKAEKVGLPPGASKSDDEEDGVPEHVFRTENLCQWVNAAVESVFPEGSWDRTLDNESEIADLTKVALSVDYTDGNGNVYIAVAGYRADGDVHVEIIATRPGTFWVLPWLEKRRDQFKDAPIVVQGRGAPASMMVEVLKAHEFNVLPCQGSDLGISSTLFYDKVVAGKVKRLDQPALTLAAGEGIPRRLGDVWVFDRTKSPVDVSPLIAVIQAAWGLETSGYSKPTASAYETRGMLLV